MPKGKPLSIQIADEADGRFIIRTFADGKVVREPVVPKVQTRRPRKPMQKAGLDRTRKKRF
jgi:hypothetical protein